MGMSFPGLWCDGLVVTLVWVVVFFVSFSVNFFCLFFCCHCSCLLFRNELGITFLIVCTKYKIITIVIIEKKYRKKITKKRSFQGLKERRETWLHGYFFFFFVTKTLFRAAWHLISKIGCVCKIMTKLHPF